ncbi:type I-U CRISPR-associated helicase/endonuclease Cas3 [Gordonia sp. NB41Y]|uniref:type I-G CRISPR-associated helicase/endonuclease Cas3g n=1 Tax=Gordonia sp. NB41Y TaxID=875808 RepID=UPI0002BE2745|nr:type I-U CRISPR-associated helicase/endonuclease Cas3 [Gordonia sp. NB41Y]EMP15359.1 hypothetical protein ISGA_515 [Gordonia sp. NB41Y]WLP90353.1 type I-U CRISPR-associated helicase/endonuclease Cas3 [Gordonia sp. NB41Y]
MTGLSVGDFEAYFREMNGHPPFRWQIRLCRYIVDHGGWPEHITAPTGSGKSAVIDVHLFVNALAGWGSGPRVPRRLAAVVNRRAIVDSHHDRAQHLRDQLQAASEESVAARVREGLTRLGSHPESGPFILSRLRGGLAGSPRTQRSEVQWFDDPAACAIICATPDMWGSRLLFRGYGTSPNARPREAGLLGLDSVMVLDEAHLNRQLLFAARRCAQLTNAERLGVPRLQIVATTATPHEVDDTTAVGVDGPDDLDADHVLARRLERPKPLSLMPTSDWPAGKRPSKTYARFITEQVVRQVETVGDLETVGCVVNTVVTAGEVYSQLRGIYGDAVLLWIGPLRPLDLAVMKDRHPDAFTVSGDSEIRVIVATQTLEVGIDVDLASLVTELAPGTSLAQRAGRVNRLGNRDQGECVVVVPETEPTTRHGPYAADELASSYRWLQSLAGDAIGLAPAAISVSPPPEAAHPRAVLSRPEPGEVEVLTTTSEDLVADIELARWLRDDLEAEPATVGVVRRGPLPVDDATASALLQATPVIADEVYPVSIATAGAVIELIRGTARHRRVFVVRAGVLRRLDIDDADRVIPGDTLIVDADHPIVRDGLIAVDNADGQAATIWGDALRVLIGDDPSDAAILKQVTRALWDNDTDETETEDTAQALAVREIQYALPDLPAELQVETPAVPEVASEILAWAVVRSVDSAAQQEDALQTWTGRGKVVLSSHQEAVARRAREIASGLGLSETLQRVVYEAGLHHDDGKLHPEFQRVLGAERGTEPLAKSGDNYAEVPRWRRRRSALPVGWRHEQLSAVYAADAFAHDPERDLIVRLVGTSHGRGRSNFTHSAAEVRSGFADDLAGLAEVLFDEGGWDELVEVTERYWGAWECAYLEGVLRAADCTVSMEGS